MPATSIPSIEMLGNEPVFAYAPDSPERTKIKDTLKRMSGEKIEIPMIIGGAEIRSGDIVNCIMPHNYAHVLGTFHKGGGDHVAQAIKAAIDAKPAWEALDWKARASIFLRAAELLSGEYRHILNAATMLCQSKTVHQAEIDAACELIDFFRFNVFFMQEILREQPISTQDMWNSLDYRPLEGFVFAVTPFNFTSIAGNLPTAPAMMGNTVVWKPASTAVYSAYYIMKLLQKAGLPDGVINMVPGSGAEMGGHILSHPDLAGVHFTGSTETFQGMWRTIGENIARFKSYPRIVGETGGKDFIFAHTSADVDALSVAIVRGAFEYQGQKCSAASRAYIPESLWSRVSKQIIEQVGSIKVGDVTDFTNFMGAVIDKEAFAKHRDAIEEASSSSDAEILIGGKADDKHGYFVWPTVIKTTNPKYRTMVEELFGPIMTIYVYPDNEFEQTLALCNDTSTYGLTGAIFADDRYAVEKASNILRYAAGNFYINDKPTGAVVGQQPFGGSRASGTNDKAGSVYNLERWVSLRAIKETYCPPKDYRYPYMGRA